MAGTEDGRERPFRLVYKKKEQVTIISLIAFSGHGELYILMEKNISTSRGHVGRCGGRQRKENELLLQVPLSVVSVDTGKTYRRRNGGAVGRCRRRQSEAILTSKEEK